MEKEIYSKKWSYDIAGFITNDDLVSVIKDEQILPKSALLGAKKTKMDARNYYVQTGDMGTFEELCDLLKQKDGVLV